MRSWSKRSPDDFDSTTRVVEADHFQSASSHARYDHGVVGSRLRTRTQFSAKGIELRALRLRFDLQYLGIHSEP